MTQLFSVLEPPVVLYFFFFFHGSTCLETPAPSRHHSKALVPRLGSNTEPAPPPQCLIQQVLDGACDLAFLTSDQVMLAQGHTLGMTELWFLSTKIL